MTELDDERRWMAEVAPKRMAIHPHWAGAQPTLPAGAPKSQKLGDCFLELLRARITARPDGSELPAGLPPGSPLNLKDVYVESKPSQRLESLVQKSRALALGPNHAHLMAQAAGDAKTEVEPPIGRRVRRAIKKKERESTKGEGWFNMKAPEMTDETRRELEVLQMRSALDPKRFYKKNDHQNLPKYFQIGRVEDSPVDYYTDRTSQKSRKKSLVDQLMADAEFKKYNKRKYTQIIEEKSQYHQKYTGKKKPKRKRTVE